MTRQILSLTLKKIKRLLKHDFLQRIFFFPSVGSFFTLLMQYLEPLKNRFSCGGFLPLISACIAAEKVFPLCSCPATRRTIVCYGIFNFFNKTCMIVLQLGYIIYSSHIWILSVFCLIIEGEFLFNASFALFKLLFIIKNHYVTDWI